MIPAGWIPPEYREFVTAQLTDTEADKLVGTCGGNAITKSYPNKEV